VPLPILMLSRPARVARLVALAGVLALVSGALALGVHPVGHRMAAVALLATAAVVGVLAPLYGRAAAIGVWTARSGLALGAVALVLPDGRATTALRIGAALVVLAGLRVLARGANRMGDLPGWSCAAIGAGVAAALLAPSLGGGVVLGVAWLAIAAAVRSTAPAPRPAAAALVPALAPARRR
jgi:hypothetical protein